MKDRIKKIRKDAGMTQVEFGERIGVKGNTVTNYETGLRNPTDAVLLSICREFNVNEEWLKNGRGEPYVEQSRDEQIAEFIGRTLSGDSEFKRRLILALSALNEDEWAMLESIADKLTKKEE